MSAPATPTFCQDGRDFGRGKVIKQWTTAALGKDELTWLKEALQLNATEDDAGLTDEHLDPLD